MAVSTRRRSPAIWLVSGGLIFVVMVETAQATSSPISRKRRASSGVRHGVDSIAGRVHQEQDARCGA
jgi:hypothetical protein